jgi:acetylornithine deacetylase/succinyl-diaminopimelate desuccinylase-like protein
MTPAAQHLDPQRATKLVERLFAESIVPTLVDYIKIPNKSPSFDRDWHAHGHMQRAMNLLVDWCRREAVRGMRLEVIELPGRTPLLFIDVPSTSHATDTVLLYGHMDKQPEMAGWRPGLGPWQPVLEGERLYGRGGADDGYSTFASLAALRVLQDQGLSHARCVLLIEACEESGSFDLPYYIEYLGERIGTPSLVVCLDSGAADYERLWCTTSLRGMVIGNLHVDVLREGVHSGDASGVVPSSFRIARLLLDRLENATTGAIVPEWLYTQIPEQRVAQAKSMAAALGAKVGAHYPWLNGMQPVTHDTATMLLNRTWRPQLAITGAAGLPELGAAGNVLRPGTALRVSVRLPPGVDAAAAKNRVAQLLTDSPPYGASVRFESAEANDGWNAPAFAPWLEAALEESSATYFGQPASYMGEGGTIPFMAMLGARFPAAQFLITGVLGPGSNAHGPNEFLDLPTARKLTCCVAETIHRHALRNAPVAR